MMRVDDAPRSRRPRPRGMIAPPRPTRVAVVVVVMMMLMTTTTTIAATARWFTATTTTSTMSATTMAFSSPTRTLAVMRSSRSRRSTPSSWWSVATNPGMRSIRADSRRFSTALFSSTVTTTHDLGVWSLSLRKPLGLILEEEEDDDDPNQRGGIVIADVRDDGSAASCGIPASQLMRATLVTLQGESVAGLDLDTVLTRMGQIPEDELVVLTLQRNGATGAAPAAVGTDYAVGTTVRITVQSSANNDPSSNQVITATVGDNLRQTLLQNNIPVYTGLKQTLGNCGGAGQCTFCAFDFVDQDAADGNAAWGSATERSEYETKKLSKFPNARLTCLHTVLGPATIRKTPR